MTRDRMAAWFGVALAIASLIAAAVPTVGSPAPPAAAPPAGPAAVPVAAVAAPPAAVLPSVLSFNFAAFTQNTTWGVPPFNVAFRAQVSWIGVNTSTPTTVYLNWSFGDGSTASNSTNAFVGSGTSFTITHAYATVGNYSATATASESGGKNATTSHKDFVYAENLLVIHVAKSTNPFTIGAAFTANVSATGGASPYGFSWTSLPSGCSAASAELTCLPPGTGTFNPTVQAVDVHGQKVSLTFNYTVNPAMTVKISYLPALLCNGTVPTAQWNFSAAITGGTSPYVLVWDFGDGTPNGTGANVPHRFQLGPVYNVTVLVTDGGLARYSTHVNVSTAYPGCGTNPAPHYTPPLVLLQGGIILLVVALVVLVLLLRRTPPKAAAPVEGWKGPDPAPAPAGASPPSAPSPAVPPGAR